MNRPLKKPSSVLISLAAAASLTLSCAIVNKNANEYSYGEECSHCHGSRLEGNRNVRLQCGGCHDLTPLPVEKVASQNFRDILFSEPHVHTARNMFSGTPSCFLCHRQNDF